MVDDPSILKRRCFDLDTAVFLANMSSLAYSAAAAIDISAKAAAFTSSRYFDADDVQGFWCAGPDVALLAFRGTSNPGQWLRDVHFFPVAHPWRHVHKGFIDGLTAVEASLLAFDAAAQAASHVWITGHSLGGALALLAAARLKIKSGKSPLLHTYGRPAVGLNDFAERFSVQLPGNLWRFVNQSDIVTRVPPAPLFRHVGIVERIVRPGVLESLGNLTEAPVAATPEHDVALRQVIAGGAALEAAVAARDAGVSAPRLTYLGPMQLSDVEFARLQLALSGGSPPGIEEALGLESWLPWFVDHAISEYIRLLSDIRSAG